MSQQSPLDKELKALAAQHKTGASAPVTDEAVQLKERIFDKVGAHMATIEEGRAELTSLKKKLGPIYEKAKSSTNVDELKALLTELRQLGGEMPMNPADGPKMTIDAFFERGRLEIVEIGEKLYVIDKEHPAHALRMSGRQRRKARRQATPAAPATPVVASAPDTSTGPVQSAPASKSFLNEALDRGRQAFLNAQK